MAMNKRTAIVRPADFATRADGDDLYLEGYFAVYDSRYNLWDGAYETIARGAFDNIAGTDVRALLDHDTAFVLGRTTAGTLELRPDERGLWGRIKINRMDQDAVNAYARVQRGDISQCSFGFEILDEEIVDHEDGTTEFIIRKVKLWEVSVVTFPAYEDTSIEARKADAEAAHKKKAEIWRKKMLARLKGE